MGSSYTVGSVWLPITAEKAYTWITADGARQHGTEIAQAMSDIIADCTATGIAEEDLEHITAEWLRLLDQPLAGPGRADGAAWDELLGRPYTFMEELKESISALTRDHACRL